MKVGEEGFIFMGVSLYSKGLLSKRLLVFLNSDISVVDAVGEGCRVGPQDVGALLRFLSCWTRGCMSGSGRARWCRRKRWCRNHPYGVESPIVVTTCVVLVTTTAKHCVFLRTPM